MNNDNTIISCAKLYQMHSNHLSTLSAKINANSSNKFERISAFMLGKKKSQVVQNGRVIHAGNYQSAVDFLSDFI